MSPKRFYCYVDETGQDTQGTIFIVTVVIPEVKDDVIKYLEQVEIRSGKGKFKWGRAKQDTRAAYIETIIDQRKYPLKIYYSVYKNTKEYKALTIITIAKSILSVKNHQQHKFVISVDALGKKDQQYYGSELRRLGIPSRRVRGIRRDKSNSLIRLADSAAGFIRDVIEAKERDKKLRLIYKRAINENVIIEV